MYYFKIDIQQLTQRQILRLKSWLSLAIFAVLLGQSIVSYLLVSNLQNTETFNTEVSQTEAKVRKIQHETTQKIIALLDLEHSSDKQNNSGNTGSHVVPFNLYCENLLIELPENQNIAEISATNFLYLNLYHFNSYLKIPHPPQTRICTSFLRG